ncbi:hypothetical protein HID58_050212 [Brassica napus]|uniref:Uncharacterized protein n=1 Tax=Brassica napus TaxID=3708 RepID=A0ABQ8A6D3_BRANA|nr:hypothetical protein HID58_050212 [Brassica napus]
MKREKQRMVYEEDCRVLRVTMRRKKSVSVSLPTKHRPHAEDLQFNQLLDPVRSGLALIRF